MPVTIGAAMTAVAKDPADAAGLATLQADPSYNASLHTTCVATQLEGAEDREVLEAALARLSPEHRAVLELAYFMGYSCAEIATIVECPVNTVKTRLFKARGRLRSIWPTLTCEAAPTTQETME